MSERMTSARAPKPAEGQLFPPAVAEWGRKTRPEMLAEYRAHFQHQLKAAQYALSFSDDEIVVETYRGVYVQRNSQVVTE